MNKNIHTMLSGLHEKISGYGRVAIAFSGGVDSTFLAKAAYDALGDSAIALTVDSEAYPPESIGETRILARHIGIQLLEIPAKACDIPGFRDNEPDRCYHCKKALFTTMLKHANEKGFGILMDGSNADDVNDYRPGMRALDELDIKSPLRELGFTKDDIRALSKELGLPTWNRQSYACLASRFPYGEKLTPELLEKAWKAEAIIRDMGITKFRVRNHGSIARIELDPEDMAVVLKQENRERIINHMKSLGYRYITIDLQGYRTGSMNEVLKI
ncbi:ATP-dependent sacrificial sulfur transferase LarE [bacterium]|nr:ATP-dependent sacrificial sulfur transferase LarE [bacterium]